VDNWTTRRLKQDKEKENLKAENTRLRKERDTLYTENFLVKGDIRDAKVILQNLQKEVQDKTKENKTLANKLKLTEMDFTNCKTLCDRYYTQYVSTQNQFDALKKEHDEFVKLSNAIQGSLEDKCSAVSKDNDVLRDYIHGMSKAQEPIQAEDYYVNCFEAIRNGIHQWAAKHSKLNATETLSETSQSEILEIISGLSTRGKKYSELLRPDMLSLYKSRRTRNPLVRHLFAIFLFEKVFDCFAFGLDSYSSDYLKWIEGNFFSQGNINLLII
jgi:chromosome segregation ATPase